MNLGEVPLRQFYRLNDKKYKNKLLFASYIKSIPGFIRGYYRPIFGHLWVTRDCNLNCSYCYVTGQKNQYMQMETIDKSIDFLWKIGSRIIGLMGGEPTLHPNIVEITNRLSDRGFFVYLSTNAFLFNDNLLHSFIDAGIDVIDISIDSVSKVNYSKKTIEDNKKNWEDLIRASRSGIAYLKVNAVLTASHIKNTISLIEYCIREKIQISIGVESNPLSPTMCSYSNLEKLENKKSFLKGIDRIIELKKGFPQVILDPLKYFIEFKLRIKTNKYKKWTCSVGTDIIQIDWDGKIFQCSKLLLLSKELTVDNISRKSFTEMMREFRKQKMPLCNKSCYSNCAYNVGYFRRNPIQLLPQIASIVRT